MERDLGLEISRTTLDGWVLKVGELLIPMVAAMRRELISGSYIQAHETPVDVQTREGRGKNHQAYLWQHGRPGGSVVFDFRLGRERDGPKRFLGQFEGILQTDGYAAYDQIGGPRMVHAATLAGRGAARFRTSTVMPTLTRMESSNMFPPSRLRFSPEVRGKSLRPVAWNFEAARDNQDEALFVRCHGSSRDLA